MQINNVHVLKKQVLKKSKVACNLRKIVINGNKGSKKSYCQNQT